MKCLKCGNQRTTYFEPRMPARDYSKLKPMGSAYQMGADGLTYATEKETPCPHDGRVT